MKHVFPLILAVVLVSGCSYFPGAPAPTPDYGIRFPAMQDLPSPNFEPRPSGVAVDMLVIHYTGMESARAALARMRDPGAKVSAHYMIDESGTVYRLVAENMRAWHAGTASWDGESNINDRAIGIELVNPGAEFGYRPFPEPQMKALEQLAGDLLRRHAIPAHRVLGHSDVAPSRKQDPGELFDWERLARAGIGLWPEPPLGTEVALGSERPPPITEIQELLRRFGYSISVNGEEDEYTRFVITAFQRHFHPKNVSGEMDAETFARLRALVAATEVAKTEES
jgi:N-acetylmuramoyl-L-alanine amidase